jgi:uncharacterized membrane protein
MVANIEKQIEVEVPVSTAYNQWTQFEEFPKFMEGVLEVQQLGPEQLYWRAEAGGKEKEWYARIVTQMPDEMISWYSENGATTGGEVRFTPLEENRTRIDLNMTYEPEDIVESVGDKLGFLGRRVEGDLQRFKDFIENRGVETGAWRGKIQGLRG